jgi:hypothetical protein
MLDYSLRKIEERSVITLYSLGVSELAKAVSALFKKLHEQSNEPIKDALEDYSKIVQNFILAISENGKIEEKQYSSMRSIQGEIQCNIEESINVDAPCNDKDIDVLEALHYMGGLTSIKSNSGISFFLFPDMILLAFRLLSILDSSSRKKHIAQIWKLRGYEAEISIERLNNIEIDVIEPIARQFQEVLKKMICREINRIWRQASLEFIQVEYLPTSTDFYETAISYYRNPKWTKQDYIVFATTSGVILPEEHYGSNYFLQKQNIPYLYEKSDKHPIRANYFKVLESSSKLKRLYFFEWQRSAKAFRGTIELIKTHAENPEKSISLYRQNSIESIESFLRKTKFGLIGLKSFPDEFNYLTLGNGEAIIISSRDNGANGQIAHGFMLHSKVNISQILKGKYSLNELIKDFVPSGMDNISSDLIASIGKGFLPIVLNIINYLKSKSNFDLGIDLLNRLKNSIKTSIDTWSIIKLPDSKPKNFKKVAEKIIDEFENI